MVRKIYKYPLSVVYEQEVELPKGFKILHIASQRGIPHLWVLVDPEEEQVEQVLIKCYGTGSELIDDPENLYHIGTVIMFNGTRVWHFFRDTDGERLIPKQEPV